MKEIIIEHYSENFDSDSWDFNNFQPHQTLWQSDKSENLKKLVLCFMKERQQSDYCPEVLKSFIWEVKLLYLNILLI